MSAKSIAASAAAVLLGLTLLFWVTTTGAVPRESSDLGVGATSPSPSELGLRPASESERRRAVGDTPQAASATAADSTEATVGSLAGTLVVLDAEGKEHDRVSGMLLVYPSADEPSPRQIAVEDGAWAWGEPGATGFFLVRVYTNTDYGTRDAIPLERECSGAQGERIEVRARWPRDSVLVVRDAASLAELNGLELVESYEVARSHLLPTGDADRSVTEGSSPVTLPHRSGMRVWWVRAAGFAWKRVEVDQTEGGERETLLVRSGDVTIDVVGRPAELEARVRLYDGAAGELPRRLIGEAALDQGSRVDFDGLVPGVHTASLEMGTQGSTRASLGDVEFEVVAEARQHVRIEVDAERIPGAPAPLSGELVLARSDREFQLGVQWLPASGPPIRPRDAGHLTERHIAPVEGDPRTLTWDAGSVTPGRYTIVVRPHLVATVVDVPAAGTTDVRIELPDLARIVVDVRERGKSQPLSGVLLHWTRSLDVALPGGGWQYVGNGREAKPIVFYAAPGPIVVHAGGRAHTEERTELTAAIGLNEITIELDPLISFEIVLKDGDAVVPFAGGQSVVLQPVDEQGAATGGRNVFGRMTAVVERPGSYILTVDSIDGFEPIPDRRIEIPAVGAEPVTVPLVRSAKAKR